MRTPDIVLRSGDRSPAVTRTVSIDGKVLDLTGYTATFNYQPVAGGTLTQRVATISTTPTDGGVSYAWAAGDAAMPAGFYAAWFEVTKSGATLSVPNDGFLLLQIVADGAAAFSYSGDPSARPLDMVRFLVQDTDATFAKAGDAEILWALTQYSNTYMAAALVADTIAAKYASETLVSRTVGDLSISESGRTNRSEEFRTLANRLRAQAARMSPPKPSARSVTAPRQFTVGQEDNPSLPVPFWVSSAEAGA